MGLQHEFKEKVKYCKYKGFYYWRTMSSKIQELARCRRNATPNILYLEFNSILQLSQLV